MTNRATKVHILPLSRKPFLSLRVIRPGELYREGNGTDSIFVMPNSFRHPIIDKTYREILRSSLRLHSGPNTHNIYENLKQVQVDVLNISSSACRTDSISVMPNSFRHPIIDKTYREILRSSLRLRSGAESRLTCSMSVRAQSRTTCCFTLRLRSGS
jgi:hypothetical protein